MEHNNNIFTIANIYAHTRDKKSQQIRIEKQYLQKSYRYLVKKM